MTEHKLNDISKILFCTDFSPNARVAFDYAIDSALHRNVTELYLLHVIPAPDAQFWKPYIYEVNEDVDQMAKKAFDKRGEDEYLPYVPKGLILKPVFRIGKAYGGIYLP